MYNHLSRSSLTWLESHVRMKHTKDRPHKCLMNGCNMSFNTPDALQRHMLRHFDPSPATKSPPKKKKRKLECVPPSKTVMPLQEPSTSSSSSAAVQSEATVAPNKPGLVSLEASEEGSSESSGEGRRAVVSK